MTVLLLLLGLGVLILGGDLLVRGSAGLAVKANIPPMVVGLTVVSMGTSAPEFLVSLQAAMKGVDDIAIGNVVGSNIANIGLILGLTTLIFPLAVDRMTLTQDWPIMMSASLLLFILALDNLLSFPEGIILFTTLILFTGYLVIRTRWTGPVKVDVPETKAGRFSGYPWLIGFVAVGIVGLKFGSDWFVSGAIDIAGHLGMSPHVIGVTVVAFGTSVPELTASIIAALKKESEISLGNIIGSNIFNILGVLGLSSIFIPLKVSEVVMSSDIYWMLAVSFMLFPLMVFTGKIMRWGGALLLASYVAYIVVVLT
jgi:cation:H+ antiporter